MAGTPDVVPETRATPAAPVPSSSKPSLSIVGLRSIPALNPTAWSLLRQASRWPSIRTRPSTEQANPQRREGPVAEWPGCRRGSGAVQHGESDLGEPDRGKTGPVGCRGSLPMDRRGLRACLQRAVLEGAWLRAVGGCRRRLILLLPRQPSASAAASWGSLAATPSGCCARKRSRGSMNGSPVGTCLGQIHTSRSEPSRSQPGSRLNSERFVAMPSRIDSRMPGIESSTAVSSSPLIRSGSCDGFMASVWAASPR